MFSLKQSGCSSHPCYLTACFGVCSSQAWGHTDKGAGNSRCCPLAYGHPAGFQLPPSLFLEKLKPYPTESTPSRTVSGSRGSHQHGFRTIEDKQIDEVQQHGNGTYYAEKEECTREEAGNTPSDTGLRTSDKVSETGEFGHQ